MNIRTPWRSTAMALLAAMCWTAGTQATPYEEDLEDEDQQHIVGLVRDFYVIASDGQFDPRIVRIDLAFADQMRLHHQGAVDMAEAYLEDPRSHNQVLRRLAEAIIANQHFEIGVLEEVRAKVASGPRRIASLGALEVLALDRGIDGLEHALKFRKASPPSAIDLWLTPGFAVSDYDIQFIRPMVEHHQAAIRMASDYNSNPIASNLLLRRMNNDIIVDQRYEIDFIKSLLVRYPGNAASVPDDPRMMAIMHRSMGGGMAMPTH